MEQKSQAQYLFVPSVGSAGLTQASVYSHGGTGCAAISGNPAQQDLLGVAPPWRCVFTADGDREECLTTSIPCLAKKDLSYVNLATADLNAADLHEATLRGATLKETNLEGADLTGADLAHANLAAASLRHATAAHANFEDADLRDADLTEANLPGARLTRAKLCDEQRPLAASAGADLDDANTEDTRDGAS